MKLKITIMLIVLATLISCSPTETDDKAVTDIDGNEYKTVKIGDQVWMAENLKVTRYRNGDPIPNVTVDSQWTNLTTGALCAYDNDDNNVSTYGLLYNWYAVNDARGLAPDGWRVPTDAEWQTLIDNLGGNLVAGNKLKEAGTAYWNSPDSSATNESGFTALPGGYRYYYSGTFYYIGLYGIWWSATESSSARAWLRILGSYYPGVGRDDYDKHYGFSVRCVRD